MGNASSVGWGDTCLPEEMCGSGNTILKYGGTGVNSKDQVIYYFSEEKKISQVDKSTSLLKAEEDAFYKKLPGKIEDYELFMCLPGKIFEPCTKKDLKKYDKNVQKEVNLRIKESKLRELYEQLEDIEQALYEWEDEKSEKTLNRKKNDLEAMIDRAEDLKEECNKLGLGIDKECHHLQGEVIVKKK